jgi:acetoin utilization deacetylase AcuC-like enzyme
VSAGFDAHYKDPLASLGLTSEAYKEIGQMIAGLKLPTFAILEGGYVVDDLGENIGMFLQGINQ